MNLRFTIVALVTITAALPPPVPAQEAPAPPVVINACGPILNNGNTQTLFGVPVASTSSGIQIQFTNESSKTANLINFAVDSNGSSFVIRDVGTFSPGVEIKHRFTNGSGQAFVLPQFVAPQHFLPRAIRGLYGRNDVAARRNAVLLAGAANGNPAFRRAAVGRRRSQCGIAPIHG